MEAKILTAAQNYPNFHPVSDADFEYTMENEVVPFLTALRKTHVLTAKDGKTIYCETFVPKNKCRALVVLFHGFCEFCSKFDELSYYLLRQGYALCRFDQFGHGFSGRETANTSKVHIRKFQTYVDCAYEVVTKIALPLAADIRQNTQTDIPLFLFAHSMGGAVAALFLQQYPAVFTAAVFSSPMFELNMPGVPQAAVSLMLKCIRLFGGGERFIPGQKEFSPYFVFPDYKKSISSEKRFFYHFNKRKTDTRLQTWSGSCAWLDESLKAIKRIFKKENLKKITVPLVLFQAEKDDTVALGGQNRFVRQIPCARLIVCQGANHELYNGTDETLNRWYPELFRFLDEFAP